MKEPQNDSGFNMEDVSKNLNVVRYDCKDEQSVLANALKESLSDWREATFVDYPQIIEWSQHGLFIKEIGGSNVIRCYVCSSETEVLDGIEDIGWSSFHKRSCVYGTDVEEHADDEKESNKVSSRVEYAVTDKELEMRIEFITFKFAKLNPGQILDGKLIGELIKSKNEDYSSLYDLLVDIKREDCSNRPEDEDLKLTRFMLEDYSCVVCLDKPIEDILLPCGHFKACRDCSSKLSNCPICRTLIERRVSRVRFL